MGYKQAPIDVKSGETAAQVTAEDRVSEESLIEGFDESSNQMSKR